MRWVAAAQLCGCVTVAGTPAPVDEWATARADRVAEASAYVARRWAEPLGSLPTPETRPSILGAGEVGAERYRQTREALPDKSERIREARTDAVTRHRPEPPRGGAPGGVLAPGRDGRRGVGGVVAGGVAARRVTAEP